MKDQIQEHFTENAEMKIDIMLDTLRKKGLRITTQRKMVIEKILENDSLSCKEIYNKIIKTDPNIGLSTVYRIIKNLEELGLINRSNQYTLSTEDTLKNQSIHSCDDGCVILLKNKKKLRLNSSEFNEALKIGLNTLGFAVDCEIDYILI